MYVMQNPPKDTSFGDFGEFGWWQFVVAAVQGIAYGSAAATKYAATEKYLKKQERTQQLTQAEQLKLKQQELSSKEQLLEAEGQRQLYEDTKIKRLVTISIVTLITVVIVGLAIYYAFAAGDL